MRELSLEEINNVVGSRGDANACQAAILGASGMGAVIGGAMTAWAGPGVAIGAGIGALIAGGYTASHNEVCSYF